MFEQVGCNFLVLYSEHNLETISLPICNYGVPAQRPLEQAINKTIGYARLKHNTLIHCSAGIGRLRGGRTTENELWATFSSRHLRRVCLARDQTIPV